MPVKIKKAKIDAFGKKVNLEFEDGTFFPLSIDDYSRLSSLDDLPSRSLYFLLLNYALTQLSFSPKSDKNLIFKLKKHYFTLLRRYRYPVRPPLDPILDQITGKINSLNLNPRQSFIRYFIDKNSQKSARHIIFLLHQQGISQSDLAPYLDEINQSDAAKIKKLLTKFSALDPKLAFSRLVRRGFREVSVKTLIDAAAKNS